MQFNVGDRVVVTRYGYVCYGTNYFNPLNIEGVVVDYTSPFWIVKWDNGAYNYYKKGTIELVYPF